jgi:hypothetical protein
MFSSSTVIALLLVTALVLPTTQQCEDFGVEVTQRPNVWNHFPVISNETVKEFYSYNNSIPFSYNGDISLQLRESVIFIHENELTCELSLVIIHNKVFSQYDVEMNISGFLQFPVVQDDPPLVLQAGDTYVYNSSTRSTTITWDRPAGITDGMAHVLGNDFTQGVSCILLSPKFKPMSPWGGFAFWGWLEPTGGTRDGSYTRTYMKTDNDIRICRVPDSPEPYEPGEWCAQVSCQWWNMLCWIMRFIGC